MIIGLLFLYNNSIFIETLADHINRKLFYSITISELIEIISSLHVCTYLRLTGLFKHSIDEIKMVNYKKSYPQFYLVVVQKLKSVKSEISSTSTI